MSADRNPTTDRLQTRETMLLGLMADRTGSIRRLVINRIADERRVSRAVASHIYACKPIKEKDRLCRVEERRSQKHQP